MQSRLSLCLISSLGDLEASRKLIASLKPYVDEVCLTITHNNDVVEDYSVIEEDGVKVSTFKWIDDFSAARKFNFEQATGDWILWLDADDTLENPENLKDLIKSAEDKKVSHIFVTYKYGFDESGNCIDEHIKANLLKNDGHFEWAGAIHEDPIMVRTAKVSRTNDITRIHNTTEERTKESYERNLRILLKEFEKNPKEPRNMFYLGRTYVATGEFDKAIEMLDKYLEVSGWDDERYEAALLIGQCLFQSDRVEEAIEVYNRAILEKETYPDAYIQKGMAYLKKEEWEKAFYNFKTALSQKTPEGSTYYNPMRYTRDIYIGMAMALMQMGQLDEAKVIIAKAYKADPENAQVKESTKLIAHLWNQQDLAKKFFTIARYLKDENKIRTLLAAVPRELSDNPLILGLKNSYLPVKVWPKKSIAVYCGGTAESWTPDSQNKGGIGGSETAVIELTKQLAKMGWDITVFNDCQAPPEGLEFDGVKYQNYWQFNPKDEFDVLWVWRLPEMFEYDIEARIKLLDLHDTMVPADLPQSRWEKIDKIFVKTEYHRSLFPQVPDDKFVIIGNGIDLARFQITGIKREPLRFAYTSTPNRGLDILLEFIWPKIKEKLPDAELHTYYGFNTFYKVEKNNPERMAWMAKVQELMKQPGVINHGRVGQKELAEDLLKTSYWLYPTHFPEIDCISVKEVQAAGVIPITSGFAALAESQKSGEMLPGDVYDPEWHKAFIEQIEWCMTSDPNQEYQKQTSEEAKRVAKQFSWDLIATKWNNELYEAQDNAKEDGSDA